MVAFLCNKPKNVRLYYFGRYVGYLFTPVTEEN